MSEFASFLTRRFTNEEIAAMRQMGEGEARHEASLTASFWPKLRRFAARLPFIEDLAAAWFCAFDPATPSRVKYLILAAAAYFVMPFDMVPDILPIIGFADDAAMIAAVISSVANAITPQHRQKALEVLGRAVSDKSEG